MSDELKILFVEDLSSDYELAVHEIKSAGIHFQPACVETEQDYINALNSFHPDVIISDYSMPSFNGTKALKLALNHNPFCPFIILTGSMNEETAVDCLKSGATDYVLKERIKRLPYAVKESIDRKKAFLQREEALKKLKSSEEQLRQAQKIANIGSWEFDFNTGLATVSDEAKNIYGIYENSLSIDEVKRMVVKSYRPLLDATLHDHINLGKPYDLEFQIIRNSDKVVRYVHSMAQFDKEKNCLLGIIRDITEKKVNQKLQQEIILAKESAKFKHDFLAHISHEIRTPLTGIEGIVDLMHKTPLNDQQKDYLETLRFSSENLKSIINEVLDYSKIEAGKINISPKPFKTQELFDKSTKLFHSICKKDLQFRCETDPAIPEYIFADRHRIFQIITNLLSNAVKYSHKGTVVLQAEKINTDTDVDFLVRISVKDDGPGIHPNLKKKLFKPFSQLHDADEMEIEGSGLGLSICRELSILLGGEIDVESKPGNGSRFWFTFKTQKAKPNDNLHDLGTTKKLNKQKSLNILLVEDKVVNQKVIVLMLESLGHSVVVAGNGKEAVRIFKPDVFDLVLMDIQMPVMNGIQATRKLKEIYQDQLPPIVGLSAGAMQGDREKYIQMGLDEYLIKPVKSEDFNRMINVLHE
ncbi:MAG: response regulator [Bacteroidales bacterium]